MRFTCKIDRLYQARSKGRFFVTIISILILYSFNACSAPVAKNDSLHVELSGVTPTWLLNSWIDIDRKDNDVHIVYYFFSKEQYKKMWADSSYQKFSRAFKEVHKADNYNKQIGAETMRRLELIKKSYADKDSVQIDLDKYPDYKLLLQQLSTATREDLEQTNRNKNSSVLDGTHIKAVISRNDEIVIANADSPTPNTHPLFYQLLRQTYDVYRGLKHGDFLSRNHVGY
ncbi:hypothetical protein GS399_16705 [Pedobacter sp. HMF7647]|uniref:Uncharacterized protein n=1 Tax=Hufsiella arboris TaxID=2695275 RepID=A0A7K1YDE9_9SPHI|nr:hypothetical protein [Hufsiella arboris]MXV52616.1 hypothetical protein [Hufsiella arboris]